MKTYIYPYKAGSESALVLSQELGIRRIRHTNSTMIGGPNKLVINWGSSSLPENVRRCRVLNSTEAVRTCADKRLMFQRATEAGTYRVPEYTTDPTVAKQWADSGVQVVCRETATGSGGEGIFFADNTTTQEDLNRGVLFTKYFKKKHEYRVHVFNGEIIKIQRKAIPSDGPAPADMRIRNHENGFVFVNVEFDEVPDCVKQAAIAAQSSIDGLLFCSADVGFNEYRGEACVFELNTASGLTGSTIACYATAFRNYVEEVLNETVSR